MSLKRLAPPLAIALTFACLGAPNVAEAEPSKFGLPALSSTLVATSTAPLLELETVEEPRVWYGWQILLGDLLIPAVAIPLTLVLAGGDHSGYGAFATAMIGVGAWFAYGPIVHALNDNGDQVGRSIAVRLLIPLAGLGVGAALGTIGSGGGEFGEAVPLAVGTLVGLGGLVGASIIDVAVLAWKTPEPGTQTVRPFVLPSADSTIFGLSGVF